MKVHAIVAKLFYHQIVVACCANMTQQILHAQTLQVHIRMQHEDVTYPNAT